jgi:hypothetical protein
MRRIHAKTFAGLKVFLLTACGRSNSTSDAIVANTARGQLLQSPPELVSTFTAPALLLAVNTLANQQLLAISGTPLSDVAVHRIRYATVGASEATTASGAPMVPLGSYARCREPATPYRARAVFELPKTSGVPDLPPRRRCNGKGFRASSPFPFYWRASRDESGHWQTVKYLDGRGPSRFVASNRSE